MGRYLGGVQGVFRGGKGRIKKRGKEKKKKKVPVTLVVVIGFQVYDVISQLFSDWRSNRPQNC